MMHPTDIAADSVLTAHHAGSTYSYAIDAQGAAHILRCITHERTVETPDRLDGHPVVAIAHSAFAALDATEAIVLPPNVTQIGWSAFAHCTQLRRIVFPAALDFTDKTWLADCDRLIEVVLPASAETIDAEFLKSCHPQRLVIGKGTRSLDIPPFWTSGLREIAIVADNPFLSTDGCCLYSRDGETLLKCLVESEEYRVQDGCRAIEDKAFAYVTGLSRIVFPDSVETIGNLAFLDTSITAFDAPPHLRSIGDRAFVRCGQLTHVRLNEGLESIGESAFFQCDRLERLNIPASVRHLGRRLLDGTPLSADGPEATFAIDPANPHVFLYGGALYRRDEDGQALTEAIDPAMRSCSVHPATRAIAERAFQEHPAIEQVELPYGCVEIGPNAFCGCKNLQAVGIPPSMERIGTRAFFDAALTSFHLPAALTYLGSCALAKERANGGTPTLRTVTIDPANEQFFMQNGILCERVADYVRAVLYVGPETDVTIPDAVTEIGPFAFVGASELERLVLHDGIKHIAPQGLAMARPPRIVEVVAHGKNETTGGEPYLRIRPTHDQHGGRAFRSAFSENRVDAQLLAQSLDRMAPYSRDAFTRMRYMVERLCDPCLLSDSARANFNLVLSRSLARFCIAIASHDWHHGYDLLAELGFLDDDTIIGAIEAVHGANDVAATAYLISLKKRLGSSIRDYSL